MRWLYRLVALGAVLATFLSVGIIIIRGGPTAAVPNSDPTVQLNAAHANLPGNAMRYYKDAITALDGRMPAELKLEQVPHDPELRRLASAWVAANAKSLALAMQGAAEPAFWLDLTCDWTQTSTERPMLRELARLMAGRAWLAIAERDVETITETTLALDALGRHFADMPTLVDQFISVAIRTLAQQLVLAPLAIDPNMAPDIAVYATRLGPCFEPTMSLADALREEAEIATWAYATGTAGTSTLWMRFVAPPARFNGEQQRYLKPILALLELPVECWTDPQQPLVVEAQALTSTPPGRLNVAGSLTHTMGGAHFRSVGFEAQMVALQRGNWSVLQVLQWVAAHGAPPPTLDSLSANERLNDPFSGRPFAYRVDGDAFTLYSFALDRDDDGGVHDARWGRDQAVSRTPGPPDGDYVFWPAAD